MAKKSAKTTVRPHLTALYELDDDGLTWTIRIATDAGEFAATANRLQDVEARACQTIRAVLDLDAADYDLTLEHVLNLDSPASVR
ncbi:MAG: hypothetical protein QOG53_1914 [Frankiales bacterium]|jgi:hypothetical protein|nr:hypothetical protein [Frankiales bacterium]